MDIEKLADRVLETAQKEGCSAAEISFGDRQIFYVSVLDGKIREYVPSFVAHFYLRVVYEGHAGRASTEALSDIDELVREAIDNAKISERKPYPMQGKSEYVTVQAEKSHIASFSERECIELALDIERRTLARDNRVNIVRNCNLRRKKITQYIKNTIGMCARSEVEICSVSIGVAMEQKGETKTGHAVRFGKDTGDIDGMIDECISKCTEKLGAHPVPTGDYRVLFTNECFVKILDLYASCFSAKNGWDRKKENTTIASECVTICEDPFMDKYPIPFDCDGVPTQKKTIVEKGRLLTLLYDLETAQKVGIAPAGNGGGIATNLYLKPGEKSFSELVCGERVLVITSLEYKGVDAMSAEGQLYENGKRVHAVDQIIVSLYFLDIIHDIVAVGNDIVFKFAKKGADGLIGSPCVLVDNIHIAG